MRCAFPAPPVARMEKAALAAAPSGMNVQYGEAVPDYA